jgi:hypothetical protein
MMGLPEQSRRMPRMEVSDRKGRSP